MKITPLHNRIQIKIDDVTAGALNLSSKPTVVEVGEVIAVGDSVTLKIKKGDKIFFKAWAVDIINHNDDKYYFLAEDTNGIVATIK